MPNSIAMFPRSLSVAVAAGILFFAQPVIVAPAAIDQEQRKDPPPHIVYILADDLGWEDTGYHGSTYIQTPTIDRLAQGGARLEQFYVLHFCTPTRAALMTGRYPIRYGLQTWVIRWDATYGLALEERTLAEALKDAGYTTAIIGKWHLGHAKEAFWPRQRGFDYHYGLLRRGAVDYFTHEHKGLLDWWRNGKRVREKGYVTTLLGQDAARYIKQHDPDKPLFLYLPFTAPHEPYQAPQEYIDRYSEIGSERQRIYAAMVTALDDAIATVVDALDEKDMTDNTLVIFHSDNGGVGQNGRLRDGKGSLYEGGTRVVALAAWPDRIRSGTVVHELIHVVDMFPTLVKLAGGRLDIQGANPLDGMDVWPTIAKGAPSPRTEMLYNLEHNRGAIRIDEWKLTIQRDPPHPSAELFNLRTDPYERNSIIDLHPEKAKALLGRLEAYAAEGVPALYLTTTPMPVEPEDGE